MSDHLLGTLVLVEANDWRKLLKVSSEEDKLNFDHFSENPELALPPNGRSSGSM